MAAMSKVEAVHFPGLHDRDRPKAVPQVAPKRPLRRVPDFRVSLPQTGRWATRAPGQKQAMTKPTKSGRIMPLTLLEVIAGFGGMFSGGYELYADQKIKSKQWIEPMSAVRLFVMNPRNPAILLSTLR